MFKSTDDLKDFLTWAKEQKILKLKVGEIEVEFSAFAFIETDPTMPMATPNYAAALTEASLDKPTRVQDDPDLFHSV